MLNRVFRPGPGGPDEDGEIPWARGPGIVAACSSAKGRYRRGAPLDVRPGKAQRTNGSPFVRPVLKCPFIRSPIDIIDRPFFLLSSL